MTQAENINVYIIGTAFSGSTLIGNALNAHPEAAYFGEISHLPEFDRGKPHYDACMLCWPAGKDCPVWHKETIAQLIEAGPGGSLDALRKISNTPIVIDGSKKLEWLRRTLTEKPSTTKSLVILATKNPFAYTASHMHNDPVPNWVAANTWRDTIYDALRTLNTFSIPFLTVKYEDFASNSEVMLKRINSFLSLDFSPNQLEYWKSPVHALGGNPGAYANYPEFKDFAKYWQKYPNANWEAKSKVFQGKKLGEVDTGWIKRLSSEDVQIVLSTPNLVDLATVLGYNLADLLQLYYTTKK